MTSQKPLQTAYKKFKRKCVGCSEIKPKDELIKITKDFETKAIIINPGNKVFGRSVYVCSKKDCVEKAFKKNRISKFLKSKISISAEEILNYCKE